MTKLSCFKACNIYGKLGEGLNAEIAYRTSCTYIRHLDTRRVAGGGEMGAHHYFRDFACCDSGAIPWLPVAELISIDDNPLSNTKRAI